MWCTRGSVGSDRKGCGRNLVVLRLWSVDVDLRNSSLLESDFNHLVPSVGGSPSPFIDEGDGFTGKKERVWMFLSHVAHTDEDRIVVGPHDAVDVTVEC